MPEFRKRQTPEFRRSGHADGESSPIARQISAVAFLRDDLLGGRYHLAMQILTVLLLTLMSALVPAGEPAAVDRLAWLTGCWSRARSNGITEEHWMAPRGGTMLGMSRTVRDGRTVEFEFIQIRAGEGTLVYEARPSGQPMATFALKSMADDSVTFENPAHDFPQRIIYRRTADGVAARIEGTMGGSPRAVDFPYSRCRD